MPRDIQKRRDAERARYWASVDENRAARRVSALTPEQAEAGRERYRAWYAANREKHLARKRALRAQDPEKFREYGRKHYRDHRDAVRAKARVRYGSENLIEFYEAMQVLGAVLRSKKGK